MKKDIITPEAAFDLIKAWNEARDNMGLDFDHEERMLNEEYREMHLAADLPTFLQEQADLIFVSYGTLAKLKNHIEKFPGDAEVSLRGTIYGRETAKFMDVANALAHNWLIRTYLLDPTDSHLVKVWNSLFSGSVRLVIEANQAKPTEKVNGKVVKGDKYVSPLAAIEKLIADVEVEYGLARR